MRIRDIVTIVDHADNRPAATIAVDLAARLDAHLTGVTMAYEPILPGEGIAPLPAEIVTSAREAANRQAIEADRAFREMAVRAAVRFEAAIAGFPLEGGYGDVLRRCRLTDLVVVGRGQPHHPEPLRQALIETVLFDSGTPVLLVPDGTTLFKPDRAMVAWDGSATAAQAVRSALPMLALASSVTIAMVAHDASDAAESGSDLATYLSRHDLSAEVIELPAVGLRVADVLVDAVRDRGFDWMVMGAYGHSRLREFLFGGPTRQVLAGMPVPVLLDH